MGAVIIGMDPHKRSATIEVIDQTRERCWRRAGSAPTPRRLPRRCSALGRRFGQRVWAVEGCNGIGRHIAQRLVADGETVVDVPAKLSARVRVFATGQGRKTDPVDAHSVAMAALRAKGLRQVSADDATVALRLLADRRDELGRARTETINRLHTPAAGTDTRRGEEIPVRPAGPCPAGHGPPARHRRHAPDAGSRAS